MNITKLGWLKLNITKLGFIPEDLKYNAEKEEEILKQAGCRDLINLMRCKNCLYCKQEGSKTICSDTKQETNLDNHCSIWTENLSKDKELREVFEDIKDLLKKFLDMKEENYDIIAVWIMGTWIHDKFSTYPYLFINAMKGSGKTRLLKLIKELSWQGDMLASLSEAVLFRTTGTLCIDEFENVGSKDKNTLRELLNTAYKKGGKVKRMKKKHTPEGDEQIVEEFSTYRPIAIANIFGMEEVLGDRCIPLILEKSSTSCVTLKVENFWEDDQILRIKSKLSNTNFWCSLCSVVTEKNIYKRWNEYINNNYINTYTTLTTQTSFTTQHPNYFNKILSTGINGRELELTFPLLLLAEDMGILDRIIEIIKGIVNEKKGEDFYEGRDVQLYEFITHQFYGQWYKIKELEYDFKQASSYDPDEEHWLNAKWLGRALKRLNLVIDKRRIKEGIEVTLNIDKAKDKLKMFRQEKHD